MMAKRLTLAALAVLGMALSACGNSTTPTTGGGDTGAGATPEIALPSVTAAATEDPPTGATGATPDPLSTPAGTEDAITKAALDAIVQQTGLSPEGLQLVQRDEVIWPDSAIGCPKEGEMALQVLTSGFRLIFMAGDEKYFVHTNKDASNVVLCDHEVPLPTNPDS